MKNNTAVIVIGIIIIALLAYLAFGPKNTKSEIENYNGKVTTVDSSSNTQSQSKELKTVKADGYSFQYDSSATIETKTSAQGTFYHVYKNEEVSEDIWLQDNVVANFESLCGKNIETHTTTLGGKLFTYCESKADPSTVYFYTKNGKTLVLITQGTNGKPYSYVVPESVEIN